MSFEGVSSYRIPGLGFGILTSILSFNSELSDFWPVW